LEEVFSLLLLKVGCGGEEERKEKKEKVQGEVRNLIYPKA
jgi:hypothetical protein